MLLFILPKKPQKMNDFSSFLAVFFYGLMSQSRFFEKKADQQGWQSRWSRKNEKSFLD
ncbi:hypothetical protein ACUXCF_003117 [Enterococcus casseliflavus]